MFSERKILFLAAVLTLSGACTSRPESADDPKHRLNDYISQSFAVKGAQDRKELAGYLTGDAKARIESWSDEQFRQAFVDTKRQFLKLTFKELKPVSANETNITYELSFQSTYPDAQGKPREAKITNQKLAHMVHDSGKWLISDVRTLKELVEYKNEMSLP
jgi:hypothetical protein